MSTIPPDASEPIDDRVQAEDDVRSSIVGLPKTVCDAAHLDRVAERKYLFARFLIFISSIRRFFEKASQLDGILVASERRYFCRWP
jgi:hypothetical protein